MTAILLPIELIEQIVGHLEYASDINALAQTDGTFYRVVNPMLYRHNVYHDNSTALSWGIKHGSFATVQRSLEAGASANECDPQVLWRPMPLAVIEGHEAIVRYLYEQGGVDIRHTHGWLNPHHEDYHNAPGSLLSLAAVHGHEALVRFFMNHLPRPYHVDYPATSDGQTPLMKAAAEGHLTIVQLLVEAGADIHARDRQQMTPLVLSARGGHLEVMQFLLQRGAGLTITTLPNGCSALCWAASLGHLECVRCLLDAGVMAELTRCQAPDSSSSHNATICPLASSTQWECDDIVDLLFERWDYLASTVEPADKAALLCVASARGNTALVRQLLESHGYDPNYRYILGQSFSWDHLPTALCWAVVRGHAEVVKVLLAHGAEASPPPGRMRLRKPLIEAILQGSESIVSMLLSAGAYCNDQDEHIGVAALKHAIPFEGIFRRLLATGADTTAVPGQGNTLVAAVLASGCTAVVQMLIDQGLDLSRHMGRANFLHQAIRGGAAVLDMLVREGKWNSYLSPEHLDRTACEQALGIAASTGQVETLEWLLDRDFPINQSSSTVNLLAQAACTEASDAHASRTIDLLLRHGLNINQVIGRETALTRVAIHYRMLMDCDTGRARMRMLLDRGAHLLPPRSLPQATRYNPYGSSSVTGVGRSPCLDEMIFQELEVRREPWLVVERLFQCAERCARERLDWQWVKMVKQYSWRVRYPLPN